MNTVKRSEIKVFLKQYSSNCNIPIKKIIFSYAFTNDSNKNVMDREPNIYKVDSLTFVLLTDFLSFFFSQKREIKYNKMKRQ